MRVCQHDTLYCQKGPSIKHRYDIVKIKDKNGNELGFKIGQMYKNLGIPRPKGKWLEYVATFIDCNDYLSTAVRTGMKECAILSRMPYEEYSYVPGKQPVIEKTECITPYGNKITVYLKDFCYETKTFEGFVVTYTDTDGREFIAEKCYADENCELIVETCGYPAGKEVEAF